MASVSSSTDLTLSAHSNCGYMTHSINAAIVNIAGRQRMLSQRIAMFCCRLAGQTDPHEQARLVDTIQSLRATMGRSHQGLLHGDPALDLPGNPSETVRSLYFGDPWQTDAQVKAYLQAVDTLCQTVTAGDPIAPHHPQLLDIQTAAEAPLLQALDTIVAQYQAESDAEQAAIVTHQQWLYEQSRQAAQQAEQKAAELQEVLTALTQTQTQLIQAEKMSGVGQLVSGIAHEINNPVNFICGNVNHAAGYLSDLLHILDLYQDHYPDPVDDIAIAIEEIDLDFVRDDFTKLIESMKVGTDRIRQIVVSLRNFSRTDEHHSESVSLHDGLDGTLIILSNRIKAHPRRADIKIRRQYGSLPTVECYPGQLNQVFMNILANAIDAIDEQLPTQPQITIRTAVINENWVEIAIADNGSGITPDVQAKLFESFFTTKGVGKGTGLGMSISQQIICDRHHGTLTCTSQPGAGAEFTIRLPIRQGQINVDEANEADDDDTDMAA